MAKYYFVAYVLLFSTQFKAAPKLQRPDTGAPTRAAKDGTPPPAVLALSAA